MRRLHTLGAVAGAAGLLAAAITPATADPTTAAGPEPVNSTAPTTRTVTLITGDTVSLTAGPDGKHAVDVRRGAGRESATFLSSERDGEVSVLPADAVPLVRAGRLDPALFNVTRLVQQGYGDDRTGATPLIATYAKGRTTPEGARRTLALPGIDGAALSAEKSTAFWADIAPALGTEPTTKAARQLGEGIDRLWLDAQVKVSLETSVPQIGTPEVWRSGHDGKGVKVAVLDTGVDTGHPDLVDRVAESRTFVPEQSVQDGHGHGTHVASTIAGSGAASDGLRKGVAPGAELLVGKVLGNDGRGQSSWIIAGMEWAANSGARIVSMSLGGTATGPSDVLSETVDELSASTGALFVIASGNSGPGEQTVGTPGIADSALTVGAVDESDRLAPFSGRGPRPGDFAVKPEITAPGVAITAARAAGTAMGTPVDDHYTTANGTSMATPHVAGAAALVAQAHPDWTGERIKEALASTARTNADNSVFEQGDGRVDVVRAVGQNVFATPTLSFGKFEDGDTEIATKDITYTNTTDKAVGLKISSSLADITQVDGTLTVPARGTATLPVGVDPADKAEGRYAGHITATADDGVRVTTGVGFEKAPKTYDLAVSLLGRDGKAPTGGSIYTLMELSNAIPDEYGFLGTGWTWEVPAGKYSMSTWIPDRDAGGLPVGTSVVVAPEIKVNGDTKVVLDAREAVEIKPRTKQDSEFQGFSTNVHREGPGGGWGLTYSQGWWTDHVYVTPTEQVTEGSLEFSAKFRLYAKELTASVTSPEKTELSSLYYSQTYEDFPLRISGDHKVRAVDAGGGTEADFAGLDVKGKVAVVALGATERAQNALDNATKAGAGYLIAYRKTPGFWIEAVDRATTVPLMIATGEEGTGLTALLKTGEKVTLKLSGTPVSPYAYNLLAADSGAISADQTYTLDASNTVRRKARYHGATAGEIGADALYTFRPWQLFGIESSDYMELGTDREEYYYVDPDTRTWHVVYPNWKTLRGQWSPLRTFTEPATEPTENWLRQVVRPGTSEEYGLSTRSGDRLTFSVAELTDSTPGHYGYVDGTDNTAKGKLYADGKLVGDSTLGGYGTFDVAADKASYRFELDVARRAAWAKYSTSTHTEWTFASARTATETALPLLTVGIAPKGLDLLNRAKSGQAVKVDLPLADQLGAVKASSLRAWVSYDDGTSWEEVTVKSGKARFTPATDAESVSLRVRATDRDGNGIDQTVLRAFGLK
ncbi:S8 family serine peptidase [Streptomyces phaeolivaceus]|uniref:S8 family serine peptidase n=1 Tax=Streptomyces phaeolivaceus TaxID=2653200 RepID=A0A5P8KCR0_9ACTN|nr:S8 family serine peptidase [Streptomyces phaeolivaceus]QFR00932.1 S8 family serine peptidase [Streptomyces phaeolivaceus]